MINQDRNIEDCYKKQLSILKDIKDIVKNKYDIETWFLKKNRRREHQLSVRYMDFILNKNDSKPISVVCFDINKSGDKYTRLVVAIDSEEFDKYLGTIN